MVVKVTFELITCTFVKPKTDHVEKYGVLSSVSWVEFFINRPWIVQIYKFYTVIHCARFDFDNFVIGNFRQNFIIVSCCTVKKLSISPGIVKAITKVYNQTLCSNF